jgi:hypothetical protein
MPTPKLTAEIIAAAIQGFEFQRTSIDGKIAGPAAIYLPNPSKPILPLLPSLHPSAEDSAYQQPHWNCTLVPMPLYVQPSCRKSSHHLQ